MRGRADSLEAPRLPFTGLLDSTRMASQIAAEQVGSKAETDRTRVYRVIHSCGGATDKEIQRCLGLDGNTERPRRIELLKAGLITDSGEKREGSTVWVTR